MIVACKLCTSLSCYISTLFWSIFNFWLPTKKVLRANAKETSQKRKSLKKMIHFIWNTKLVSSALDQALDSRSTMPHSQGSVALPFSLPPPFIFFCSVAPRLIRMWLLFPLVLIVPVSPAPYSRKIVLGPVVARSFANHTVEKRCYIPSLRASLFALINLVAVIYFIEIISNCVDFCVKSGIMSFCMFNLI